MELTISHNLYLRSLYFLLCVFCSVWGSDAYSRDPSQSDQISQSDLNFEYNSPKQNPSSRRRKDANSDAVINDHELLSLSGLMSSGNSSEVFRVLHGERRWAINTQQLLRERIEQLKAETKMPQRPIELISDSEYNQRTAALNKDIEQEESRQLNGLSETDKVNARLSLISLTRQKGSLGAAFSESQSYYKLKSNYDQNQSKIQQATDNLTNVTAYLLGLDDVINSKLLTTDSENEFKKWICLAFSVLVGIVIIGFFIAAYKERGIRAALFANDSGLQFVTLFSLIIAIILFGVINVLEGRELAALLGGLSGYILGRGNFNTNRNPGADREAIELLRLPRE